jgi:hypothetical protein
LSEEEEKYFANARFKLYGSFRELENIVGFQFLESMHKLNQEHNLGLFEFYCRV